MEYLPTHYAGKFIKDRLPHAYFGELDVENAEHGIPFPASVFGEQASLPMEIHRMKTKIIPLAGDPLAPVNPLLLAPVRESLLDYIKLMVKDADIDYQCLKVETPPSMLQNDNTGFWEWCYPHSLTRTSGMEVDVDNDLADFIIGVDALDVNIVVTDLRVRVTFEGYKLVLGPPSPLESMVTAA